MNFQPRQDVDNNTLPFMFKGNRKYVHGTDIYKSIINYLVSEHVANRHEINSLQLIIRKMSHDQCYIELSTSETLNNYQANTVAQFSFNTNGQNYLAYIRSSGIAVNSSYEYSEETIYKNCILTDESVTHTNLPEYTTIESLVAMNKYMHNKLLPDVKGKWLFTKLDISRVLSDDPGQRLELRLTQNVANRMTRSLIIANGSTLGNIYFSLLNS